MSARRGDRRRAREYALQLLFQLDQSPHAADDVDHACREFWEGRRATESVGAFADAIVRGAMEHRDAIDRLLSETAHHWKVSRMAVVDRNILRMALYEFLFHPETPPVVVIDEAIEIAKKFGNEESGDFVNGILDAIRIRLDAGEIPLPGVSVPPGRSSV